MGEVAQMWIRNLFSSHRLKNIFLKSLLCPLCFLIFLSSLEIVYAETTEGQNTQKSHEPPETKKRLSLSGTLETSRSLHEMNHSEYQSSFSALVAPAYQVDDKLKMIASFTFTRDLMAVYEGNEIGNPKLKAIYPFTLNPFMSLTPSASLVYGLNETSVKRDSYFGSVIFETKLGVSMAHFSESRPLLSKLGAFYQFGMSKNFHEFQTNTQGASNSEYLFTHTLGLSTDFTSKLSLSLVGVFSTGLTYETQALKNSFTLAQELSYQVLDSLSVYVSHSNGGAAFKENGIDSNIAIVDSNNSTIATGLSMTL